MTLVKEPERVFPGQGRRAGAQHGNSAPELLKLDRPLHQTSLDLTEGLAIGAELGGESDDLGLGRVRVRNQLTIGLTRSLNPGPYGPTSSCARWLPVWLPAGLSRPAGPLLSRHNCWRALVETMVETMGIEPV
ncbi:MAG: hypothetical protein NVSMB12_00540 [Acidimicrobiales bacterium]